MDQFAHEHLFGPLGIRDYKWRKLAPNAVYASGDLKLRPRDMAKIGYLYMQGGNWNGRQIISQKWIEESTAWHVSPADALSGYGYQWSILRYQDKNLSRELYIYFASGYGGQSIIVVPELSMVVVITAGNYRNPKPIEDFCPDYVFASVIDMTENEK